MRWLSSLQDRDIELLELMEQHRQLQVSFVADDPRQVRRLAHRIKPTCRRHAIDCLIHPYRSRLWPSGLCMLGFYFHELMRRQHTDLEHGGGNIVLGVVSPRQGQ